MRVDTIRGLWCDCPVEAMQSYSQPRAGRNRRARPGLRSRAGLLLAGRPGGQYSGGLQEVLMSKLTAVVALSLVLWNAGCAKNGDGPAAPAADGDWRTLP